MRYITVLGSTGSIGTQTLEVCENLKDIKIEALTANSNIELLEKQARKFMPALVCVVDVAKARELKIKLSDTDIRVIGGKNGMLEAACMPKSDTVVTAIVGICGLMPTIAAITAGKNIALANKETLVTAGDLIMKLAREKNVKILPVDSEHSAIFQCLETNKPKNQLKRILLTASGGPFFGRSRESLKGVKKAQALKHPTWSMGAKITIDSASLMNKGLEVIEAAHLFGVAAEDVTVLVHRQSIVHSMVEFIDNAVLAQLGVPDMKLPIQYALTYPDRMPMSKNELDLFECGNLTFEKPDLKTFKCLSLAYSAMKTGGTMPVVMNGANEKAVELFLNDKIEFLDIAEVIADAMSRHKTVMNPSVQSIIDADIWARETIMSEFQQNRG